MHIDKVYIKDNDRYKVHMIVRDNLELFAVYKNGIEISTFHSEFYALQKLNTLVYLSPKVYPTDTDTLVYNGNNITDDLMKASKR